MKRPPYILTSEQLKTFYNTNIEQGLSRYEVQRRLKQHGLNKLPEKAPPSLFTVFISQFKSPLIYILLIAALLMGSLGYKLDALVISAVLFFNALVGTVQEGRAQALLESLKRFISSTCTVVRSGKKKIIETKNLVPGDIILIQEGERVPADARLIVSHSIKVDEAILTGESSPVEKTHEVLQGELPLYEQRNMVFAGTYILSGNGLAVVIGTGISTAIGAIHKSIEHIDTRTPLRKQIEKLSYVLIISLMIISFLLLTLGLYLGRNIPEMLLLLVAMGVSVIPEGLPIVVTLVLAAGAYRMAQKHVLIKKLQAVEGLGRTDIIITDKTGTLTRNEMMVLKVFAAGQIYDVSGTGYFEKGQVTLKGHTIKPQEHKELFLISHGAALLSQAQIRYDQQARMFQIKGDPLEAGMKIFAHKVGAFKDELKHTYELLYDMPFDPVLRLHVAWYKKNDHSIVFAVGAPEAIMKASKSVSQEAEDTLQEFLSQGLRVIALAYKEIPLSMLPENYKQFIHEQLLGTLEFLGILGIQDAIRPDVKDMVTRARHLGLDIIMATGDHKQTALFVAQQTGIMQSGDEVLTGQEFKDLSDTELLERLDTIRVYARFSPQEKMRLVSLFHKQGKLVAMTGDGVNDVPSIVAADLGIAMGINGTEIAQQAADMVLLDDSFSSIIRAIEEGRHIFYTLRRVLLYLFTTNLGEVLILSSAFLLLLPFPLLPVQVLWLNLVTDGFLDIALATEKSERSALQIKQQSKNLVDHSMLFKIIWGAFIMTVGTLLIFMYYLSYTGISKARTIALTCMAAFQWFNAWNCRSEKLSLLTLPFFSNRWLIGATAFVVGLQILAVENTFFQKIFRTVSLTAHEWIMAIIVASSIILFEELRKWYFFAKK